MMSPFYKALLPNRALPLPILGGPFRGAVIQLNPQHSLRKVFGVYEYELNGWLKRTLPAVSVVYDVGASDGYFTYGCAQALKRSGKTGHVVAFEPLLAENSLLSLPLAAEGGRYEGITFEFIPLSVGATSNGDTVTLDKVYEDRPFLYAKPALVKVDVEGAEVEVLSGASELLREPHQWLVEVHGKHLIEPVRECFHRAGRTVRFCYPRPHWLLGPENRGECCWCLTI